MSLGHMFYFLLLVHQEATYRSNGMLLRNELTTIGASIHNLMVMNYNTPLPR